MLLTVNKNLNIRVGTPRATASCPGYLVPGDNIDLDTVVLGDELDGNAIWYRSKSGYYYWSGGVLEVEFELAGLEENNAVLQAVINDILHNYSNFYSNKINGYLGCGMGKSQDNTINNPVMAIFVDVHAGAQAVVPDRIKHKGFSIKVEIVRMAAPRLQSGSFLPGDLIRDSGGNIGTAGVKVSLKGKDHLLSCYHVFAAGLLKEGTTKVTAADNISVAITHGAAEGRLEVVAGEFGELFEYALAVIPDDMEVTNLIGGNIISEYCTSGEVDALMGKTLHSHGFLTENGNAEVIYTVYDIKIGKNVFKNVIHTRKLSVEGDSGAPVLTADHKLVGFVFAGDSVNFSYIIPVYKMIPDYFNFF